MYWIFTILIIAAAIGIFIYIRNRPNEKKIQVLEEEGSLEDAIYEYTKLFEKNKLSSIGLWRLINLYIKTGRRSKAISKLRYAMDTKKLPENIRILDAKIKLASLLYEEKKDKEALPLLLDIYNEGEYVPDILKKIGSIAYSQGDYENTKKFLNKYIDIVEKDEEAINMCASSHIKLGEIKQAVKLYNTLTNLDNTKARYYFFLALSYLFVYNFEKANENFSKSLEIGIYENRYITALRGQFIYELINKNFEKAINILEKIEPMSTSVETGGSPQTKERIIVDKALLYLCVDDIENKPYMIRELSKNLKDVKLDDSDFKKDLIKLLKKDNEIHIPQYNSETSNNSNFNNNKNQDDKSSEVNTEESEEIKGKDIVYQNYPKPIAEIILKWIVIGFSTKELSDDIELSRDEEFEIKDIFKEKINEETENNNDTIETPLIDKLMGLTSKQTVTNIARKVLDKLGLNAIDEIFVDEENNMNLGDGVDFIAEEKSIDKEKYFVAFRRWNSDNIGDFAIKSVADTKKIIQFDKGIFIAPGKLSNEAMAFLDTNQNIRFIGKKHLEKLLDKIELNELTTTK
ncbi:MAG: restriction endonuclease [Spirochaetota bacterium]